MTDRLKLSDLKGGAKADNIARDLGLAEHNKRIAELERNIAELERLHAAKTGEVRLEHEPTGSNKIGARKSATFKAISTAPSINMTPRGSTMVPVAYVTVQDLSSSIGVSNSVRFNGEPVYLLDGSSQPDCKGDEQGTCGGIRSGTVGGAVKPVAGSRSVRVQGKQVVRQGDACTMNGGNNPGVYVTVVPPSSASPKDAIRTSDPPITLDTSEERSAFSKWLEKAESEIRQAMQHPIEGVKGVAKGVGNTLPALGELLLKVAAEQRASELDNLALMQGIIGRTPVARAASELAKGTRETASRIDLPKLMMSNPAQEGGDKLSSAIQIFAGGAGILKGVTKWLGTFGKAGRQTSVAQAAGAAAKSGEVSRATASASLDSGNGVKILAAKKPPPSLRSSALISNERAEKIMVKNGLSPELARDFVSSFDGPISARVVRPGEEFFRYTDVMDSKGSFLTKVPFPTPAAAVEGLYLGPYGNSASLMQSVQAVGRSIVLEGNVANGAAGVRQSVILNRNAFTFGQGTGY